MGPLHRGAHRLLGAASQQRQQQGRATSGPQGMRDLTGVLPTQFCLQSPNCKMVSHNAKKIPILQISQAVNASLCKKQRFEEPGPSSAHLYLPPCHSASSALMSIIAPGPVACRLLCGAGHGACCCERESTGANLSKECGIAEVAACGCAASDYCRRCSAVDAVPQSRLRSCWDLCNLYPSTAAATGLAACTSELTVPLSPHALLTRPCSRGRGTQ